MPSAFVKMHFLEYGGPAVFLSLVTLWHEVLSLQLCTAAVFRRVALCHCLILPGLAKWLSPDGTQSFFQFWQVSAAIEIQHNNLPCGYCMVGQFGLLKSLIDILSFAPQQSSTETLEAWPVKNCDITPDQSLRMPLLGILYNKLCAAATTTWQLRMTICLADAEMDWLNHHHQCTILAAN